MTRGRPGDSRFDLENAEAVRPVGASGKVAIISVVVFVSVLFTTILVGISGSQPPGADPVPEQPGGAGQESPEAPAALPLVLLVPGPDTLVDGGVVGVRGSATEPLGTVAAALIVAGREIATSKIEVERAGEFSVDVPFIAPPFATLAEVVLAAVERPDVPVQRQAVRLGPPTAFAIDEVSFADGRLVVRGTAPRRVEGLDVEVVGPDGTVLAAGSATPTVVDGWGGLLIPTSEFRAEIDLTDAAKRLSAGTPLTVELSWQDPWQDSENHASFLLIVPDPAHLVDDER